MRVPKLTESEVAERLSALSGWSIESDTLVKTFTFPDFVAAIKFVNALAVAAEAADHHPDLDIRYNKVKVALTTHDSGGLTKNDFELAAKAEGLL